MICTPHPILCGYKIEKNVWGGGRQVARMLEGRCMYSVLVGKPEGNVNFLTSCKPIIFSKRALLHGVSK